jgi:hypothetical protein
MLYNAYDNFELFGFGLQKSTVMRLLLSRREPARSQDVDLKLRTLTHGGYSAGVGPYLVHTVGVSAA